ncbi:MAG: hypothetical protein L0228_09455 [Planctomycetes bacterium]|nr:hypothetical protein [Planctomycetota bacterium]
MKHSLTISMFVVTILALGSSNAHGRGFGGYHGGFAGAGAFRGYHGGFGVGGMYEGALDGPRGFSGYNTNWTGFRGGYGLGTLGGYQGGYGLGYGRAGGLSGFDNYNRLGPWSRGIAGWRGELGQGGGYVNLGYGPGNYRVNNIRPSQYGALSRIPGYLYGPTGTGNLAGAGHSANRLNLNWGLPTDLNLHQANGLEHRYGYSGDARGLTAFDPTAATPVRRNAAAPEQAANAARAADGAAVRNAERAAVARNTAVTHYWPAADLRSRGHIIRRDVLAEAAFGPTWYDDYAGAWIARNIVADLWTPAAWTTVNDWFGTTWPAFGYNYGDDITYDNGNVNLYGEPIATPAEYFQSAVDLAAKGKKEPPQNVEWLPLGVFAAVRGVEKSSNMMFQLAVDKAGTVRGNYFNTSDKNEQHIEGAVDTKTQRVAWIVEDRANIVFDTGLYNLTKDETPVLVHFGKDKTEQWTLVRLTKKSDKPEAQ